MKTKQKIIFFILILSSLRAFSGFSQEVGARVFANWDQDEYYYPATIIDLRDSEAYIVYDDFTREWVPLSSLEPDTIGEGARIQVLWNGDEYYHDAVILQRLGFAIHVRYEDDTEEYTTIAHIRIQ